MASVSSSFPLVRSLRDVDVRRWAPLFLALGVALALRLALWGRIPRLGMVSDEGEYLASAVWLAQGRSFDWHQGWLWTRAPLYPLFLAVHIRLFGLNLTPIYVSQTVLSLIQVVLVYLLARVALPQSARLAPALAALLMALYFPLAVYTQVLLSETLYITLLLAALLALAWWAAKASTVSHWQDYWPLVAGSILLGLATLTRGLALGFVPLAAGWIWWTEGRRQKAEGRRQEDEGRRTKDEGRTHYTPRHPVTPSPRHSVTSPRHVPHPPFYLLPFAFYLFLIAFFLVLLPWSLYATRLYGGLVAVDTTGAYNLLLGARTAYDGNRKDAATRTFVLALLDTGMGAEDRRVYLEKSCLGQHNDPRLRNALYQAQTDISQISQAQRQQLMTAEGLCLIRERPLAFVQKSLGEFIDFFRINYGGDERFTDGFTTGRLPPAYTIGLFLLDDTLYVLALPLAVVGWALAGRAEGRRQKAESSPENAPQHPFCLLPSAFCLLAALWWLYNLLAAPLLFAINRFRVPLMPLVLIYAAYGIVALASGDWRMLGRRYAPHLVLAAVLLLVVIVPASWISSYDPVAQDYRAQQSYLGPHPASVADTWIALQSRSQYGRVQALQAALGAGDSTRAGALLAASDVPSPTLTLGRALLAGPENRSDDGLALLPSHSVLVSDTLWNDPARLRTWGHLRREQASVVQGDLLRREGKFDQSKAAFTPIFVDNANPVEWAWNWLHPPPLPDNHIDMGGNLDLGYIQGFYLGEGDWKTRITWRWSSGTARLRFPGAGTGASQTLRLRIDGASIALPNRSVTVLVGDQPVSVVPLAASVQTYDIVLPPTQPGGDVIVTLQSPVFVPPASDFLAQQGAQAGQLRLLGLRIDWAELR